MTIPSKRGGIRPGQGRKTQDGTTGIKRYNVSLDEATIVKARYLGNGNLSEGIRIAVTTWPGGAIKKTAKAKKS